LQLLPFQGQP